MMTNEKKQKQLERLLRVPPQEWREVKIALTRRLTERLNAIVICGEHGEPRLVGGRTQSGAHSEVVLQMNALDYYVDETILKLYECLWEWREELSIKEQCLIVLDNLVSKQGKKFQRQTVRQVDVDVETLREDEEPTDEEDEGARWYDTAMEQVKDEPELEMFLVAIDQLDTPRERCKWLGIDSRQYDNLRKKVSRRLNKIIRK